MPRLSARALAVVTAMLAGAVWTPPASMTPSQAVRPFIVAIDLPGSQSIEPAIHPIARFTGTEWVNTWPEADDADKPSPTLAQIPRAWLDGPVPLAWTRWSPDGARTRVTVISAEREQGGCTTPIVLRIAGPVDGARDRWAPDAVRVAVSTDQPVEWVRRIAGDHQEAREVLPIIEQEYRQAEATIAAARHPDWTSVLDTLNAARATMSLETLVRPASDAEPAIQHFRVARRSSNAKTGIEAGVEVRGWLRRQPGGGWSAFETTRELRGGERSGQYRPLAVFRLAGRVYWLVMLIGYESLGYAIDDVSSEAVRRVVIAGAGGC